MRNLIKIGLGTLLLALAGASAQAAEEQGKCEGQAAVERKERGSLIGERTYRRLSAIHEQMGNEEYGEALKGLKSLSAGNLNDYEMAKVNETYGYIYAGQGKYDQAIPYFQKALDSDALTNASHFGLMYSLAQLYAGQEQHQRTIDLMLEYLKFQCDPPPQAYIALASSYSSLNQYNQALPWVQKAIAKAGDKAQESWYLLELAIYFEQKNYPAASRLLTGMVAKWPDKLKYWEMLSGSYQEQQKDIDALATLMVAYEAGLLDDTSGTMNEQQRERKLLNIARMNLFVEVPYMAGRLIEKEMGAGRIKVTQKNLELLLSAWTAAREFDKAVATIDRLAPMKSDGELYMQKAQLLAEKSDWQGSIDAARQALEKGGLKSPGGAYLLIGISANEMRDFSQAIDALNEARKFDDKTRRQASDWIKFVEERRQAAAAG
jgi:tetratricopeptide (TPR) repeat protein